MKRSLLILFAILSLSDCSPKLEIVDSETSIVIEGIIEDGEYPVVLLSRSLPVREEMGSVDEISDYILKWARVTISDGQQEVVLMGIEDTDYYPPYKYTTTEMIGQAGTAYKITAKYKNLYGEATTTIPPSPKIIDVTPFQIDNSGNQYGLKVRFINDPEKKLYYSCYVSQNNNAYKRAFLSTVASSDFDEIGEINVLGRIKDNQLQYLSPNVYYFLKLVSMERPAYDFWLSYDNSFSFGANPLFPSYTNLSSNINGGLGYWFGYGSDNYYTIILQ